MAEEGAFEGGSQTSAGSRIPTPLTSRARLRNYDQLGTAHLDQLTLATLASVDASVTTVGCMTLCTARLNIGSTRFLCPPDVAVELVFDETFEPSEVVRRKGAPSVSSASSEDI